MIRFIWNSWWRNKDRFILLLVGALIVSTGLSYLVGITEANKGTIVDELQKRWNASYHIVVRPQGTRAVTEEKKLLEPNYLSGLSGGITLEQYEQIKAMPEIDVAAPIAMIGYVYNNITLKKLAMTEPGVYRLRIDEITDTGAAKNKERGVTYFTVGPWQPDGTGKEYGVARFFGELSYGTQVLLAAIDPEEEAKLVGIDQAVIRTKTSRFFEKDDRVTQQKMSGDIVETSIPVLLSNREFVDSRIVYTIEKLNMPFADAKQAQVTMEKVKANGGETYLQKQRGTVTERYTFTSKDAHEKIVEAIRRSSAGTEAALAHHHWVALKPSPVQYDPVTSPFADRWPFAYQVKPYNVPEQSILSVKQSYRPVAMFSNDSSGWPRLRFDFIGVFDPQKLNISKDPLTELPMETYFPAKAKWVLDAKGNPVNPPTEMKPLNTPYGFLTKPPLMLTTLEAAQTVLGDKPIAAVRIKVKGVDKLTAKSEAILQHVAKQIEERTGLITDITLGSSPQPALTYIPGIEGKQSLGWIEQPWIKLGSSISIFQEAKVGLSGVIASVIVVAIVYVFSSNLMMMYARRKEFAVLLSLGWRPYELSRLLFIEATVIGLFVSVISWLILGFVYAANDIQTSGWRIGLIGVFGLVIYWSGAFIPAMLVRRIQPYEAMRTGEVSAGARRFLQTRSLLAMSFNYLCAKWKRSVLSILAIALPTSLFIFFLFVTFRLKGVMYATWLGRYVAMEVGAMHYVAMGVALLIAMLTTAEIIWQNISERRPEIAVLKAVGWPNRSIRLLVLCEGALSGFIAGLLGIGLAFLFVWRIYGDVPLEHVPFMLAMIFIPVGAGVIGALLPAGKAVKMLPYQGMQGTYENTKQWEKKLQYAFMASGAALFIALLLLMGRAVSDVKRSDVAAHRQEKVEGTKGNVTETFAVNAREEKQKKNSKDGSDHQFQQYIESAYKTLRLGESTGQVGYSLALGQEIQRFASVASRMEEITIPLNLQITAEGSYTFKPYSYVILDEKGHEYSVKKMTVVENQNWIGQFEIRAPGKVKVLLTFEVPTNARKLIMIIRHDWLPGDIVVQLK